MPLADFESGLKVCSKCNEKKSLTCFSFNKGASDGLSSHCTICKVEWLRQYRKTPEGGSRHKLNKRKYNAKNSGITARKFRARALGVSPEAFDTILRLQGFKCAICQKDNPNCLDHCHATGKVRGVLCHKCNTAIGSLGDSEQNLMRAILYLEAARKDANISSAVLKIEAERKERENQSEEFDFATQLSHLVLGETD